MPIIIFALNISYKSLHYNTKYNIFKPSFLGYKLLMFFIVPIMKLTILFLSKFLKFYSQKNDIQLLVIHDESFLTRLIILSYKIILLMDSVKSESRIDLMFLRNIFWVNSEPVPIYNWHHRPLGPCTFVNGRPMMTLGARPPETYMGSANVRFLSLQLEGIHFRLFLDATIQEGGTPFVLVNGYPPGLPPAFTLQNSAGVQLGLVRMFGTPTTGIKGYIPAAI